MTGEASNTNGGEMPRVRDLTGRDRLLVWGVLGVLALTPVVGAILLLRNAWMPVGDVANIAMRAGDVFGSDSPLLGQPTTGAAPDGSQVYQLGPFGYWVLAPFVLLLPYDAGVLIGAAFTASAALVCAAWLTWRMGRDVFVITACFLGVYVGALGVHTLVYPLNATISVVWLPTVVLAAWAIWRGDLAGLPIFVFGATYSLHNHLLASGAILPLLVLVPVVTVTAVRRASAPWHHSRPLVLSLALATVAWWPTVVDALFGSGNLQRLLVSGDLERTAGTWWSAERLVNAIGPLPQFLLPFDSLRTDRTAIVVFASALVLGGLGAFALHLRRRGNDDVARLVSLVVLLALGGLVVGSRSPGGSQLRPETVGWVLPLGLLTWFAVAVAAGTLVPEQHRRLRSSRSVSAALLIVLLGSLVAIRTGSRPDERWDGRSMRAVRSVLDQVDRELPPGTYVLSPSDVRSSLMIAPALSNRLRGSDRVLLVIDSSASRSIHPPSRIHRDGPVDGTLVIRSVSEDGQEADDADGHRIARTSDPTGTILVHVKESR